MWGQEEESFKPLRGRGDEGRPHPYTVSRSQPGTASGAQHSRPVDNASTEGSPYKYWNEDGLSRWLGPENLGWAILDGVRTRVLVDNGTRVNSVTPAYVHQHKLGLRPMSELDHTLNPFRDRIPLVGLGGGWAEPLGFTLMRVQIEDMPHSDEQQVVFILDDPSGFSARIPVILGTPTINRVMQTMKETEMHSAPTEWQQRGSPMSGCRVSSFDEQAWAKSLGSLQTQQKILWTWMRRSCWPTSVQYLVFSQSSPMVILKGPCWWDTGWTLWCKHPILMIRPTFRMGCTSWGRNWTQRSQSEHFRCSAEPHCQTHSLSQRVGYRLSGCSQCGPRSSIFAWPPKKVRWQGWGQAGIDQIIDATKAGAPPHRPWEGRRVGPSERLAARTSQAGKSLVARVPPCLLLRAEWDWVYQRH